MKKLWLTYIAVGIGAFLISFTLEFILFKSITGQPYFSFFLTLVLESAKVLTVIFHRFVSDSDGYDIPEMVSYLNTFFKTGLIFLSLVCSIAIISKGLDRPLMDSVKTADEVRIKERFNEKSSALTSLREQRLTQITGEIKQKYEKRYRELDSYYLPRIADAEAKRNEEFDNVGRNGLRKGPQWTEFDRQLQGYKSEYRREKDKLRIAENGELERHISEIENDFQKKIDLAMTEKESGLSKVSSSTYKHDERAKNPVISSFLTTMDEGLNLKIAYLSFAILISLLVSLLLEVTIYLTFSYVVMFYSNILTRQESNPVSSEEDELKGTQDERQTVDAEAEYVGQGVGGDEYEFFQNLQNQFGEPVNGSGQQDRPCSQAGEEV